MLHFTKKHMNDWSDRWDRARNNSEAIKREQARWSTIQNCPDVTKVEPKWKRERSDVWYSLAPRCVRGASRSLRASSSDEFSWDSAPSSTLSFFAKSSSLLTASPYSSSLTSHGGKNKTKRKQLHVGWNSPLIDVSGFRSSVSLYVEQKWHQRIPIWGDADAQPEGLASCLSHLAPSALR